MVTYKQIVTQHILRHLVNLINGKHRTNETNVSPLGAAGCPEDVEETHRRDLLQRIGVPPMSELITANVVADRLRVTPQTVRRLAREGKLPAVRVGRTYRFDWDKVWATVQQEPAHNNEEGASI